MRIASVVERRNTFQPELHGAAHHPDSAYQTEVGRNILGIAQGHVVDDLAHPIGGQESGDQDVGIGDVNLLA